MKKLASLGTHWLMLLVTVVGFALFCQFLSVAFRNRWVAWLLASVLILMVWILPPMAQMSATSKNAI